MLRQSLRATTKGIRGMCLMIAIREVARIILSHSHLCRKLQLLTHPDHSAEIAFRSMVITIPVYSLDPSIHIQKS